MSTKDWVEKDYYKILGVPKDASAADIKKAFRKIARENHPDQHPGDTAREKRFKEASEANSVLSDPEQRKEYDDARKLFGGGGFRFPRGGGAPGGGSSQNAGFEDLFRNASGGADFSDLFGGFTGRFSTGRSSRGPGPRRGSDVEGEVTIDFADAVEGVTVSMQMVSDDACQACHGTGARAGTVPRVCPTCEGAGMVSASPGGSFSFTEPCPDCRGRGLIVDDPCPICHGSGRAQSTRTMQVRIPAGVNDGQRIRLKGKGSPGENGGAAGDLYVIVHVLPHAVFGRKGDHVTVTVPVTFVEASLGAEIDVPTLSGNAAINSDRVRLRIPAGTPNGRTFRVRGKGVAKKNGERGDLLVTVEVAVPDTIGPEAKAALEEYGRLTDSTDPRADVFARVRADRRG
ncbi:molecular chaperone DnaJ [Naumannella halotolerans]|uniref:Chaperone protein DnaJ n=1 Tax=Naumannella halotolerans TaxID=993414 RepID=A0A4V3ENP5_9ACTN|nr:molecular chaperone DnaJ [Naumannella halotolerans]TDT34538.1 molecular chaperone DnaJ [Naumannella halotolerans]